MTRGTGHHLIRGLAVAEAVGKIRRGDIGAALFSESASIGSDSGMACSPNGLTEAEAAHAKSGGIVIFKQRLKWWLVGYSADLGELLAAPADLSGLLGSIGEPDDGEICNLSPRIEAELRRRAMAAVIATAQADSPEQPTAPVRRRMGSI